MTNKKITTMTLNEYQKQAMTTCMDTCHNFSYMLINLVGEVGEFASKISKAIRKGQLSIGGIVEGSVENNVLAIDSYGVSDDDSAALDAELKKEAGDILWQLSGLCEVMGWTLEDVARTNLNKLASRQKRGVIDGNGDNR